MNKSELRKVEHIISFVPTFAPKRILHQDTGMHDRLQALLTGERALLPAPASGEEVSPVPIMASGTPMQRLHRALGLSRLPSEGSEARIRKPLHPQTRHMHTAERLEGWILQAKKKGAVPRPFGAIREDVAFAPRWPSLIIRRAVAAEPDSTMLRWLADIQQRLLNGEQIDHDQYMQSLMRQRLRSAAPDIATQDGLDVQLLWEKSGYAWAWPPPDADAIALYLARQQYQQVPKDTRVPSPAKLQYERSKHRRRRKKSGEAPRHARFRRGPAYYLNERKEQQRKKEAYQVALGERAIEGIHRQAAVSLNTGYHWRHPRFAALLDEEYTQADIRYRDRGKAHDIAVLLDGLYRNAADSNTTNVYDQAFAVLAARKAGVPADMVESARRLLEEALPAPEKLLRSVPQVYQPDLTKLADHWVRVLNLTGVDDLTDAQYTVSDDQLLEWLVNHAGKAETAQRISNVPLFVRGKGSGIPRWPHGARRPTPEVMELVEHAYRNMRNICGESKLTALQRLEIRELAIRLLNKPRARSIERLAREVRKIRKDRAGF